MGILILGVEIGIGIWLGLFLIGIVVEAVRIIYERVSL